MAAEPQASIQLDDSLMWENYIDSASKIPNQVLYQEVESDQYNQSGFTFHFRSPADNALLDNEVIIKYPVTLTSAGLARATKLLRGKNRTRNVDHWLLSVAFRQCCCVARSIQNLSVTINGSNFNVQPLYWLDALNRLYFSEEEARTICSTSGGGTFDGDFPGPFSVATAGIRRGDLEANNDGNVYGANFGETVSIGNASAPATGDGVNRGFDERVRIFIDRLLASSENQAALGVDHRQADQYELAVNAVDIESVVPGAKWSFELYERLPIPPFLFHPSKDPKMSIPNIRTVSITAQFVANRLLENMVQGEYNGFVRSNGEFTARQNQNDLELHLTNTIDGAYAVDQYGYRGNVTYTGKLPASATLMLKWRLTDMQIPPVVRIPCPRYVQYLKPITGTGTVAAENTPMTSQAVYSNIQLDSIPDKFIIFVRRKPEEFVGPYPSEMHLAIQDIKLTIGGASGRLTSLSPVQMYDNYIKYTQHGGESKLPFDPWYKYRCTCVLEPSDIGLVAGAGYNYKTNMTIQMSLKSFWNIPAKYNRVGLPYYINQLGYYMVVLCLYNHQYLELNSSGGSRSGMTMIPRI